MRFNLRKSRARRVIAVALGGLFLGLVAYQIWGQNGYVALRRKVQEQQEWQARNGALRRQNEALEKRIRELKSDPNAIEKIAREELMMARPEDKVILTPQKK